MNSSWIPPPFPFPEVWSRIFMEQQQRQERKWLMPTTFGPAQCYTAATAECDRLIDQVVPPGFSVQTVEQESSDDTEGHEDSGYEYQYVLSDEWRERFQSSIQLQRLRRGLTTREKKKKAQKKVKHMRNDSYT
ncbi:hypothetical protein PsorP6_014389 [Peronosclerospora sorghi]|uniref:Uncharacterized protein n=1 Tax=Peronosclerospora sorghi TaxID=230839 RepID=A0ACC0VHP9_9STRA|nr:hypothetical protein PsorP6_014389 [Peronosclerospora sorghi]